MARVHPTSLPAGGALPEDDAKPGPALRTADDLAQRSAAKMWATDLASQHLGMQLDEVHPGHAVLRMKVTETMLNGHGICHGGYIFALADSAFAFACNTYGKRVVAAGADVTFLRPVGLDVELVAVADERSLQGRSGIYDVTVSRRSDSADVAEFRGRSRSLREPVAGRLPTGTAGSKTG
jgi:phenylacetic acid degradation protein PaaD